MSIFFNNKNTSDIGKLIHVGAGSGIELNEYVAQNFTEIFLLEPIPKVFKQLDSKVEKLNEVNGGCTISALNVALSSKANTTKATDSNQEQTFYITQPNRYSSFHKADKLKSLFQNLKTDQEVTVNTLNLFDLIQKADLDKNKNNALVLQINGEEFDVLEQAEANELMQFSSIVIQHAKNDYFGQTKKNNDLVKLMENKGFQLAIETDNDVVFSSLVFRKDVSAIKLSALSEQNESLTARIAELKAELENQLKASNEAKVSEISEAIAEAKAEVTAEATAKANTSAEQNKNHTARISELENQLKASNEAKVSEITEARAEAKAEAAAKANTSAEQNKNHTTRISELENQIKASNEAKVSEVTEARAEAKVEVRAEAAAKANATAEQNKKHTARIAELENQLKASNEAKVSEITKVRAEATAKANTSAEQNKNHRARIVELESQLKESTANTIEEKSTAAEIIREKDNQLYEKQACITVIEQNLLEKNDQLTAALNTKDVINEKSLNQLITKINEDNKNEINNLHNKLEKHITKGLNNSIKQVESFIGVQRFLESGDLGMNFHGWPISSDIALYLLGKIKTNNYDLIIEFGSGTSTQLFAKAMMTNSHNELDENTSSKRKLLRSDGFENDDSEIVTYIQELPQRVLTFEHNKKYYNKTKAELEENKLADIVNLVHAPLVDHNIGNEDYLYYDCDKALSQIADIYQDREAKILVLVDGPPGSIGPLARFPAMSKLLNYLGKHQLDVLLDDYIRPEEKKIANLWKEMLNERFFTFEEEFVQCEKEALVIRVNPCT